jgi:phi13 family phage major tail protein
MSLTPVGETTPFYADDVEYFTAIANNGYDGTLEVALLPDGFRKDVLGEFEDAKKVLFEDSSATLKAFALLFEFTGDTSGIKHVLYNCKATRPNLESTTKGQSIEAKTETLNLTVRPAIDTGLVKAKSTDEVAEEDIAAWYTAVYLENESTGV